MTDQNQEESGVTEREQLFEMLPPTFQQAILSVPDQYFTYTELELKELVDPTQIEHLLRFNLWRKFREAKLTGAKHISNAEIYTGVCTHPNFYVKILRNPQKIAWLLMPIHETTDVMREALDFGIAKIRNELLTQKITDKNAAVILKAVEFLANRTLGPVVQRIESKNLNLNVGGGGTEAPQTREALEAKLLELQQTIQGKNESKLIKASEAIEEA